MRNIIKFPSPEQELDTIIAETKQLLDQQDELFTILDEMTAVLDAKDEKYARVLEKVENPSVRHILHCKDAVLTVDNELHYKGKVYKL